MAFLIVRALFLNASKKTIPSFYLFGDISFDVDDGELDREVVHDNDNDEHSYDESRSDGGDSVGSICNRCDQKQIVDDERGESAVDDIEFVEESDDEEDDKSSEGSNSSYNMQRRKENENYDEVDEGNMTDDEVGGEDLNLKIAEAKRNPHDAGYWEYSYSQ